MSILCKKIKYKNLKMTGNSPQIRKIENKKMELMTWIGFVDVFGTRTRKQTPESTIIYCVCVSAFRYMFHISIKSICIHFILFSRKFTEFSMKTSVNLLRSHNSLNTMYIFKTHPFRKDVRLNDSRIIWELAWIHYLLVYARMWGRRWCTIKMD